MEFISFKKAWGLSLRENFIKNILLMILSLALTVTSFGWFRSHETVVLVPPMLDERVSISRDVASTTYQKKWGLFVAQMIGNIHPGNIDFVMEGITGMLSPAAYSSIKQALADQVSDIKRDSLSISFQPKQVVYENETQKVFISGDFQAAGPSGEPKKLFRTYEFIITARFGQPWIDQFRVYSGPAKTLSVLTQERVQARSDQK